MDEIQDLLNETTRNEQYWERMVEIIGSHKDALEKGGKDVSDRLQDLVDMSIQEWHIYHALIVELDIIRHG